MHAWSQISAVMKMDIPQTVENKIIVNEMQSFDGCYSIVL